MDHCKATLLYKADAQDITHDSSSNMMCCVLLVLQPTRSSSPAGAVMHVIVHKPEHSMGIISVGMDKQGGRAMHCWFPKATTARTSSLSS